MENEKVVFVQIMERKKILLVSSAFYPEISPRSFRATELAKEFYRQGHQVVVITQPRDHDYTLFLQDFPIVLKMWSRPRFPRIPKFKRKPFSILTRVVSRILQVLFEYPFIEEMYKVSRMLRKEAGYDLMISFAVPYPVHWGVAKARSPKRPVSKTWVADCGDPYMGDVLDSFRKPFYFGILEKRFSRKADYISIPVESARPAYYPEFHHKIRVIPQGFEFELHRGPEREVSNPVKEFAYAGGFLHGIRDPGALMRALVNCKVPFKFHVFTNQPEVIREYQEALDGKLNISGYIERDKLMEILSGMDFLINFDNNTTLNVPSKLIDYALTGRPVLNIARDFSEADLMAFLDGNYTGRLPLPDPEHYHIKNITLRFLDLINQ
jgi:hypothetical protein